MAQKKIKTLLPKKYNRFLGNKVTDSSLKQNREELLEWMAAKEQGGYKKKDRELKRLIEKSSKNERPKIKRKSWGFYDEENK